MTAQTRDAQIARLVLACRLTYDEIGNKFGISRGRVHQIAKTHGVVRGQELNRLPADAVAKAAALVRRGMPISHAAESAGIKRGILSYRLIRDGLYKPTKVSTPWSKSEEDTLRRRYGRQRGEVAKLARDLGRTRNEIIGKADRMGLTRPLQEVA